MKKLLVLSCILLSTTSAFASVAKSYDAEQGCDLYRAVQSDENGKPGKLNTNETIFINREVYGMAFESMEVNFDNREVLVQPMANIILGFNKPLTAKKTAIAEDNKDFNFLINQLNRKISLFEKVCITRDGKIAYAKMFPDTTQTPTKKK